MKALLCCALLTERSGRLSKTTRVGLCCMYCTTVGYDAIERAKQIRTYTGTYVHTGIENRRQSGQRRAEQGSKDFFSFRAISIKVLGDPFTEISHPHSKLRTREHVQGKGWIFVPNQMRQTPSLCRMPASFCCSLLIVANPCAHRTLKSSHHSPFTSSPSSLK